MKKNFLVLFSLFISFSVFSQQDSIVNYLDRYYKKVKKEQATYIQTIVKNKSLWLATVYHGNGKIKLQGNFKKKNLKTRIGLFRVFDNKGNLSWGEYFSNKDRKEVHVFQSNYPYNIWRKQYTFKPNEVRHIHKIFFDKLYFLISYRNHYLYIFQFH